MMVQKFSKFLNRKFLIYLAFLNHEVQSWNKQQSRRSYCLREARLEAT